jgi:hypothetical protein
MRSCSSSVVFMDESAEQIASVHPAWPSVADDPQTGGGIRRFQSERPVWTMGVVVGGIDPEDLFQVASSDDQQPVQALGADGADPALGVGVRVGCLHRRQEHLGTVRTEDVVEPVGELRVTIAQHKAEPASLLLQHQQQVAGLLGDPGAVGLAVTRPGGPAGCPAR